LLLLLTLFEKNTCYYLCRFKENKVAIKKQIAFVAPIQQCDHNKVFYLNTNGFNPADSCNTGWAPTQNRLKGFKTGLRYTRPYSFN
jgi:hypothetical protein